MKLGFTRIICLEKFIEIFPTKTVCSFLAWWSNQLKLVFQVYIFYDWLGGAVVKRSLHLFVELQVQISKPCLVNFVQKYLTWSLLVIGIWIMYVMIPLCNSQS